MSNIIHFIQYPIRSRQLVSSFHLQVVAVQCVRAFSSSFKYSRRVPLTGLVGVNRIRRYASSRLRLILHRTRRSFSLSLMTGMIAVIKLQRKSTMFCNKNQTLRITWNSVFCNLVTYLKDKILMYCVLSIIGKGIHSTTYVGTLENTNTELLK